jgi:pimeloyl-ACP methyl ester carboxylesterase
MNTHFASRQPEHVVALHSSAASGRQWAALSACLADDFVVHAPDLHGHGDGPEWRGEPDAIVDADAARVARTVAAFPGGAYLVGHSYGGAVALRVALDRPDLVRGVIVYEPVVFRLLFERFQRGRPAAEVREIAAAMRREIRAGSIDRAAARFIDYWVGQGAFDALPAFRRAAVVVRMPAVAAHFAGLATDAATLQRYRSLRAPVLHLSGGTPREPIRRITELLRSALPNAAFATLPALGHMGPISHPQTVALRIERQLRAWSRRTATEEALRAA